MKANQTMQVDFNDSQRFRYEAFSKFAAEVCEADSLEAVQEAMISNLKYIIEAFCFHLTVFTPRRNVVLSFFPGESEILFPAEAGQLSLGKALFKRQNPQFYTRAQIDAESLFRHHFLGNPAVQTVLVFPVATGASQALVLAAGNKNATEYRSLDFKFARLTAQLIRTKMSQILNHDRVLQTIMEKEGLLKEIEYSRSYIRNVVEAIPDPVVVITPQGLISEWNRALPTLSGYGEKDLRNKALGDLLPGIPELISRKNPERLAGMKDQEWTLKTAGGGEIPVLISVSEMQSPAGEPGELVCSIRDISERKRHEESEKARELAEKALKFKDQFLAKISHEIRTPMNGIIGMVEVLERGDSLDEQQREYVRTIHRSSKNLLSIINDILDLSKLEAGQLRIVPTAVNLSNIVTRVAGLFAVAARDKNIELKTRLDNRIPDFVLADGNRIFQILSNFVSNAVKFTEDGSVIVKTELISKTGDEYRIRFSVKDSGPGIPEQERGKLFQDFSQLEASATKNYIGTGLGLSICKNLVDLMDGEIGVESGNGQGSTFWADMPVGSINVEEYKKTEAKRTMEVKPFELHVLVVDDSEINLMIAEKMLKAAGCTSDSADSGERAIECMESGNRYDLILMDVQMPIMDGVETTRKIKSNFEEAPPIVGLSASAMYGDAERYIGEGMDDYMVKPITLDSLNKMLSKWFGEEKTPMTTS